MLEKIYSVFVSSTYEDLREERAEVQRALLMAKCFPIGMEAFPSTDEETWEFIKRQIEDADFYLLIVAGRYGSADEQGISFTEKEYDYAKELKKPILAFIHSDPGNIISSKTDRDNAKQKSLLAFITKIQARPLVSRYTTPHELRAQVLLSITNLKETDKTAIGFVRSNQIADLKKYVDVLEENSRLRTQLDNAAKDALEPFPEAGANFKLVIRIVHGQESRKIEVEVTWANIFLTIAEALILDSDELTDSDVDGILGYGFVGKLGEDENADLTARTFNAVKSKLYARGLVKFETKERPVEDRLSFATYPPSVEKVHIWHLTEVGRTWFRKLLHD